MPPHNELLGLPVELIREVVSHLPTESLLSLILTCKFLRSALETTYDRALYSTYTLYPAPECAAHFFYLLYDKPKFERFLTHLKIRHQNPMFSSRFTNWLLNAYQGGKLHEIDTQKTYDVFTLPGRGGPTKEADLERFQDILVKIIKRLPALETVEFATTFHPIPISSYRQCNDLDLFNIPNFTAYRNLKIRGYGDWVTLEARSRFYRYSTVFNWVLDAFCQARHPLKRILYYYDSKSMPEKYSEYPRGTYFWPVRISRFSLNEYKETFGNLKELEICADLDRRETTEIFETMQCLESLQISHPDRLLRLDRVEPELRQMYVFYPLRTHAKLTCLRRLELSNSDIALPSLREFLLHNTTISCLDLQDNRFYTPDYNPPPTSVSLQEIGGKTWRCSTDDWMVFFDTLKDNLKLAYLFVDIPAISANKTIKLLRLTVTGLWTSKEAICRVQEGENGSGEENDRTTTIWTVSDCFAPHGYIRHALDDRKE
ncbi:hypothetical protein TWF694_011420 [Orbilia ellipsospora]|uniref:F-box domain-containing protein n=1 Tax=Orbilia ellipsospora TaxID=2528407 RepID=A0AAV9X5I5_9PEZI